MPDTNRAPKVLLLTHSYVQGVRFDPFRQSMIDNLAQLVGSLLVIKLNDILEDSTAEPRNRILGKQYLARIREYDPDIVLSVTRSGLSHEVMKVLSGKPILTWYMDSFVRIPTGIAPVGNDEFSYLTSGGEYRKQFLAKYPQADPGKTHVAPFCTDLQIFAPSGETRNVDVAFVGSAFNYQAQILPFVGKLYKHPLELEKWARVYLQHRKHYIYNPLEKLAAEGFDWSIFSDQEREKFQEQLLPFMDDQISTERRMQCLSHLAHTDLAIYGQPEMNWYGGIFAVNGELLKRYRTRQILDLQSLAMVYKTAKISLNVPHYQAYNHSLPFRVFDIFGSKSLLLTHDSSNVRLRDLGFHEGEDFASFSSPADLPVIADKYLSDERERTRLTDSAFRKVQSHTMESRLKSIFQSAGWPLQPSFTLQSPQVKCLEVVRNDTIDGIGRRIKRYIPTDIRPLAKWIRNDVLRWERLA